MSWWEPEVGGSLDGFAIDPRPGGLEGVGTPPPGVAELATEAVKGVRSSFTSALQLERFLRENYRRVNGAGGHAWPQLRRFLLDTKEGPPVAPGSADPADSAQNRPFPIVTTLLAVAAFVLAWLAGVPSAKWVRARMRRRQPGSAAVLGAWLEARDRLREHRVRLTAGMTPLELAAAAARRAYRPPRTACARWRPQWTSQCGPAPPQVRRSATTPGPPCGRSGAACDSADCRPACGQPWTREP